MSIDRIELYKNVTLHISTAYGTGTGFYLKSLGLIITNEHVVRGAKQVVIEGQHIEDLIKADVVYLDPKYDLAFLKPLGFISDVSVSLSKEEAINGEEVFTLGHPFGLKYTATNGIISKAKRQYGDINYIQTDAPINPGNSGGPLVRSDGTILGVNTFIIKDSNNLGFALSVSYLQSAIDDFLSGNEECSNAVRCRSCENIVHEKNTSTGYCTHCGDDMMFISDIQDYKPTSPKLEFELLLQELGYDMILTRRGSESWQVKSGSAMINFYYDEQSGFFNCLSTLVKLPKKNIKELYQFLLKENFRNGNIAFSLTKQYINLSLKIYDKYINNMLSKDLIKDIIQKADDYDDILVNEFGAKFTETP